MGLLGYIVKNCVYASKIRGISRVMYSVRG